MMHIIKGLPIGIAQDGALHRGNEAFRAGKYKDAMALFQQAAQQSPGLIETINLNIALTEARSLGHMLVAYPPNREIDPPATNKIPITALIIGCAHLPRSYILADRLHGVIERVVLTGLQVGFNESVECKKLDWDPERASVLPLIPLSIEQDTYLLNNFERIVTRFAPDIVISFSAHFPTVVLGAMFKKKYGIPLVLEGDDSELSPINSSFHLSESQFYSYADEKIKSVNLHGIDTTERYIHSLITRVLNRNKNPVLSGLVEPLFPQALNANTEAKPAITAGKDIVVFWKQNDTGLYGRRPDMIIKYLASRADVRKVIVVDAPISEADLNRLRRGHILTQDRSIYTKTYEKTLGQHDTSKVSFNVFIYKQYLYSGSSDGLHDGQFFTDYTKYLEDLLAREGVDGDKSVFWFYPKNFLIDRIISKFNPEKVVVDVVDDHRAWPGVPKKDVDDLTAHYKKILQRADFAFANCQPVVDSMRDYNPDILLVPNGCEERPGIIEPIHCPLYMELKEFKGKVIGFVGNLESKIDIPLIEKLAVAFPKVLIVLAGSTHANPATRELARFSNIRMFGVVDYKYTNAIVMKFSIGIVPHKKTPLTENMNPLKVFMYLSNRIPVVSTDVSNLPQCDAILLASTHEKFIGNCDLILSGDFSAHGYDDFIRENCWRNRFSRHIDNLLA